MAEMTHSELMPAGTETSVGKIESKTIASAQYMIALSSSGQRLEFPKDAGTLLEALERHEVVIEYQCRSGYCGSCRCRMIKGQVNYRQLPLAFLNENEILPCCCLPASDIELDV